MLANFFHLESGCANPPDLSSTAFLDTTASKHLVTPDTKTSNKISSERITVVQPSGDKMQSTHAVDLVLLSKLPPDAQMAHFLPGLTNNLLSVLVLYDSGCEVFFNATGCEVTLMQYPAIWMHRQRRTVTHTTNILC